MSNLQNYLAFIKETEQLKSVLRTAFTSSGRRESTADHTWRLTLFAALLGNEYFKKPHANHQYGNPRGD